MVTRRDVLKSLAGLGLVAASSRLLSEPELDTTPVSAPVKYYQLDNTMVHRKSNYTRKDSGVWTPDYYVQDAVDAREFLQLNEEDSDRRWKEYLATLPNVTVELTGYLQLRRGRFLRYKDG